MTRQTIHVNDTVNHSGVLECCVQQAVDNALDISWEGCTYTERFKGPYAELKKVSSNGGSIFGTRFVIGRKRPNLTAPKWDVQIQPPTPVDGMMWILDGTTVSESEAGEHGIVEFTWKAAISESDGGYGTEMSASASVSVEIFDSDTGWTLRWGTYSRSPLEYCTIQPNDYEGTPSEKTKVANANNVLKCAQYPKPRQWQVAASEYASMIDDIQYMWIEPNEAGDSVSADIKMLNNPKEKMIYNYQCRGVQPVFHYPILTYNEKWEIPLTPELSTGRDKKYVFADKVDHIIDMDRSLCPFQLSGWTWIDCGTESETRNLIQKDKAVWTVSYTRTWEGCLSADLNFYGDGNRRWIPGATADQGTV